MNDHDVVIVSAVRTPIGKIMGSLSAFTAPQLGGFAIKQALARVGFKGDEPDEVFMGHVAQGGSGQAPARQAMIAAGMSPSVPATTINRVCGSGLKAVMLGAQAIRVGDAKCIVAGGMESMSHVPHYLFTGRTGVKLGDQKLVDGVISDGLWCSFNDSHMGGLAEYTAEKSGITREMQDEFAYNSHQKAVAAQEGGKFKNEMIDIEVPQRKKDPIIVNRDETPRGDTSIDVLAKLPTVFKKGGTVTPGNAPGLNDGAAAVVVMSAAMAKERGLKPMARIMAAADGATEPKDLFYAPVIAVNKVMDKLGMKIDDFDLIEANEAFSAQALADGKELGWNWNKVNVHGGAVALGHPIGASGTRVLVTLLNALEDRGGRTGLATLCLGGGGAVALAVERV
jgi:acetyl-CoA C-acetyltransferase